LIVLATLMYLTVCLIFRNSSYRLFSKVSVKYIGHDNSISFPILHNPKESVSIRKNPPLNPLQQQAVVKSVETSSINETLNLEPGTISRTSLAPGCHPLSSLPKHLKKTSRTGIPNLLHLIYADTMTPEEYTKLIQHCTAINSQDMNFVLWTNDDARAFLDSLQKEYKQNIFDRALYELERSDVLRYILLYHFGGMYMDMDEECIKPLWPLLNEHNCLLDQEDPPQSQLWHNKKFVTMNSAMACRPSHPFFKQVMTELKQYINKPGNVIDRTGPLFLTEVYLRYLNSNPSKENNVTMLPSSAFSPLKDTGPDVLKSFRGRCQEKENLARNPIMKMGCDTWAKENYQVGDVAEKTKDSYLVHKFLHLGHMSGQSRIRIRQNLCTDSKMTFFRFSLK
jgi:hypothetical protein